jgi:hypothetical protein
LDAIVDIVLNEYKNELQPSHSQSALHVIVMLPLFATILRDKG